MNKICALDLDGVLVDFVGGACNAHSMRNPYTNGQHAGVFDIERAWGMTNEQFWHPLNSHKFWANLAWTVDGPAILQAAEKAFGKSNVYILSKPCDAPESASGKLEWIQKNMPDYARRYLLGPAKEFAAHAGAVLIDDNDANIDAWRKSGGVGVLVPRPWNSAHDNPWKKAALDVDISEAASACEKQTSCPSPTVAATQPSQSGEVRMVDPVTGGEKGVKPERMELIPVEPLEELARVYGWGAGKYTKSFTIVVKQGIQQLEENCTCSFKEKQNAILIDLMQQKVSALVATKGSIQKPEGQNVTQTELRKHLGCANHVTTETSCNPTPSTPPPKKQITANGQPNTQTTSSDTGAITASAIPFRSGGRYGLGKECLQDSVSPLSTKPDSASSSAIDVESAGVVRMKPNDGSTSTTTTQQNQLEDYFADAAIKPSDSLEILRKILGMHLPTCQARRDVSFEIKKTDDCSELICCVDGSRNWTKGYKWGYSYGACLRHLNAFWRGEDHDKESGLLHLAHACWHTATLMWFVMHKVGTDDRLSTLKKKGA